MADGNRSRYRVSKRRGLTKSKLSELVSTFCAYVDAALCG